MKRIITSDKKSSICSGISVDQNLNVVFNWRKDSKSDVISLLSKLPKESETNGVRIIYGYQFKSNASREHVRIVRDWLKNIGYSDDIVDDDIHDFIETAVTRLDTICDLSKFDVCVHIKPNRPKALVHEMGDILADNFNRVHIDFETIKRIISEVKFNKDVACRALQDSGFHPDTAATKADEISRRFSKLQSQGAIFEVKKFLPRSVRYGFVDFLQFKNDADKQAYAELQDCNVLVYDDFYTSGATISELLRYLKSINPNNKLTVFVLVKLK